MFAEFVQSWALFHNTYLAGWLMAVVLALVGVLVVARDQIFLGAAVSQCATLGVAVAMSLGMLLGGSAEVFSSEAGMSAMAVVFSVLGALLASRREKSGRDSHEAVTGWVFLLAASLSVLLMAHSPHGMEEIHRLLLSSIIGATGTDVLVLAIVAALTAGAVVAGGARLLLFAMDPDMAFAAGMRVRLWASIAFVWIGFAIGFSIRTSGTLYTFGCLVLPALVAKNLCREVRPMLFWSPVVALVTGAAAFVLANHYDYPPAQMAVALLCGALLLAWVVRRG
jgi:ABC-type Mn2+/Zn2+ transport system permease subunit